MQLSQDIHSLPPSKGVFAWVQSLFGHKPLEETPIVLLPKATKTAPTPPKPAAPVQFAGLSSGGVVQIEVKTDDFVALSGIALSHYPGVFASGIAANPSGAGDLNNCLCVTGHFNLSSRPFRNLFLSGS